MKEKNGIKTIRTMQDNEISKQLVAEAHRRFELAQSVLKEKKLTEEKYLHDLQLAEGKFANELKLKEIAETKLRIFESVYSDEHFSEGEIKAAKKETILFIVLIVVAIIASVLGYCFGLDYLIDLESRAEYESRTSVLSKPLEDAKFEIQKTNSPNKQDLLNGIDELLNFELNNQATPQFIKQREDIRRDARWSWWFSLGGGLLSSAIAFYIFYLSMWSAKTHWFHKLPTRYKLGLYYVPLVISFINANVWLLYSWKFIDVIKFWGLFYLSVAVAGLLFPYVLPKYKEDREKKEFEEKLKESSLLQNGSDLESINTEVR